MKRNIALRVVKTILSLTLLVGLFVPEAAAAATTTSQGSASGLSISPLRQQLTLSPGQSSELQVTLKNITGGPVEAVPTVRDFTSDGVDGNPKIITNSNEKSPASIRGFLTGISKVPLTTGEQKTFTVNIHVPTGTTPGAYYGLIEYQAVPANNGSKAGENSKVALTAAVSQLVFITVPGKITQLMQIKSINVYHDKRGATGGVLFTSPPKAVGIELANLANDFEQPYGTAQIQRMGGKVVQSFQVNNGITRGIVLPDSTRIFINPIKKVTRPGSYTVEASITYGSKGSTILVAKKTFWYIPMWLIITLLVIVLILIAIVLLAYRRYKRGHTARYHR